MWNSGVAEPLLFALQDVFLVILLQKFSKYGSQTGNSRSWEVVTNANSQTPSELETLDTSPRIYV